MSEMAPLTFELDGLAITAANGLAVLDSSGFEDGADITQDMSENWGDGQSPGLVRVTDRAPSLTIGFHDSTTEAQKDALRAVMSPRTNRTSPRVVRWRGRDGTVQRRMHYQPAPGRALSIPGDYNHLVYGYADAVTARLHCADGTVYSDGYYDDEDVWVDGPMETEIPETDAGDASDIEIVNEGSLATTRGAPPGSTLGTMQWSITAGPSGCTRPFVMHGDYPHEFWMLDEGLGPDAVVSVSWDRLTRRNTTVRYAEAVGPDGCPIPIWPALRPGSNTITVGCLTGSLAGGTFYHRSTW